MEYKEKVKLLDLIIKNIENTEMFDIGNILYNHPKVNDDNFRDISDDIKSFGEKNNLFSKIISTKGASWYKLTPKGEDLKNFGKGFVNFKKSLNEKNDLEIENLKLQNEAIEYSKKIREQEQRIRNLDESLKTYEFVKKY